MVFPASEWGSKRFEELFPRNRYKGPNGESVELPPHWDLLHTRMVEMKNIGDIEVREVRKLTANYPFDFSAEQWAKERLQAIREAGRYWGPTLKEQQVDRPTP